LVTRPFQDENRGLSGFGQEVAAATAASFLLDEFALLLYGWFTIFFVIGTNVSTKAVRRLGGMDRSAKKAALLLFAHFSFEWSIIFLKACLKMKRPPS